MAKPKIVTITHDEGTDAERSVQVNLVVSQKPGMNYHLPKGSDGYHFPNLESVESFFQKKHRKAKIEIS